MMLDKKLKLAGLDASRYSPHKLRHTAATLMLKNGVVAGNINFEHPDEDSAKLWIPAHTIERPFDTFLSNSFGFGGTNSTLIVRNV